MVRTPSVRMILIRLLSFIVDILGLPITLLVASWSRIETRFGPKRLPLSYKLWDVLGVSPIPYHYYQPIVKAAELKPEIWKTADPMLGIDLNVEGQLNLLRQFHYQEELKQLPLNKPAQDNLNYYYNNSMFEAGDGETLYNIIRYFQPSKMIEIGSGFSTRMAKNALAKNRENGKVAEHICIEPYEAPWLEKLGVDQVIRQKVEELPLDFFQELGENDILFIDSSHVLRTGGDVVYEYLRILPSLQKGVLIHVHDIYLPFEYPREWLEQERWYWNEQYLLQGFLAFNSEFEVLLAQNYLAHYHKTELAVSCPVFGNKKSQGTSSFWLRRK